MSKSPTTIRYADNEPALLDARPAKWRGSATVVGPAVTQGSMRAVIHRYLKRAVIFGDNDKALKAWRRKWISAMGLSRPPRPIETAVAVSIAVCVNRPASHYGSGRNFGRLKLNAPDIPIIGRDVDKIARAVLDSMKLAGWVRDDNRVARLLIERQYTEGVERVECEAVEL